MSHRLQLLESLQSTINIPFCIYNSHTEISYSIPDIPMPSLMKYVVTRFNNEEHDMDTPLIIIEEPSIFIAISKLSDYSFLILGPCLPQEHSDEFINHFFFGKPYSKDKEAIKLNIKQSKLISIEELKNALCLAYFINTAKELDKSNILVDEIIASKEPLQNLQSLLEVNNLDTEDKNYSSPESINNDLYSYFAMDGIPVMEDLFKKFSEPNQYSFTKMSLDHDRQTKYVFMVVANKICQEAIRSGVGEDAVNVIAEIICQRVDSAPTYFDVRPYYVELIAAISEVVNNHATVEKGYSPMISNCVSYINSHVQKKLNLSILADICNVSGRWLSKCFRKEVGVAIPDYINNIKLQRSTQLLLYSNATIEEISDFFCFSNQSYYSKLFKEKYSCTPLEYRNNKNIDS